MNYVPTPPPHTSDSLSRVGPAARTRTARLGLKKTHPPTQSSVAGRPPADARQHSRPPARYPSRVRVSAGTVATRHSGSELGFRVGRLEAGGWAGSHGGRLERGARRQPALRERRRRAAEADRAASRGGNRPSPWTGWGNRAGRAAQRTGGEGALPWALVGGKRGIGGRA